MTQPPKRKNVSKAPPMPPVLRRELKLALRPLSHLAPNARRELLERFRRGELRIAAPRPVGFADGLTQRPVRRPDSSAFEVSAERLAAIARLDEVDQKLKRYRSGGVADYLSSAVEKEARRRHQQVLGRRPKVSRDITAGDKPIDHAEIASLLRSRDYSTLEWGIKGRVRRAIAKQFGVSERTVSDVARRAGLQRPLKRSSR